MSATLPLPSQFISLIFTLIKYGIIVWHSASNSGKVFTLHKQIVIIVVGAEHRGSCRSVFRKSEILPASCQYISSLMKLIVNNLQIF
jgi:hypothetical protein